MRPTYEHAIRAPASAPGQTVLDVGCGSGAFLRVAADAGAVVSGIDASEALLAIARERVPDADLSPGDLQRLPYADDSFDAVTGFCSFFFADDMVEALREAGRVAKPGAPIVIQVWGRPERFDLGLMKAVLARFRAAAARGPARPVDAVAARACSRTSPCGPGSSPDAAFDDRFGVRVRRRGQLDEPGDDLRRRLRRRSSAHQQDEARAARCSRRSRSAARPAAATGSRTTGTS